MTSSPLEAKTEVHVERTCEMRRIKFSLDHERHKDLVDGDSDPFRPDAATVDLVTRMASPFSVLVAAAIVSATSTAFENGHGTLMFDLLQNA